MQVTLTTIFASQNHIPVGVTGFEPATSSSDPRVSERFCQMPKHAVDKP